MRIIGQSIANMKKKGYVMDRWQREHLVSRVKRHRSRHGRLNYGLFNWLFGWFGWRS